MYRLVSWLGAATDGDASRWSQLGVAETKIEVLGDTRHDHVLERISNLHPLRTLVRWAAAKPVLVAGSTDARDEQLLIQAFSRVPESSPGACLMIVPHECSERRISEVQYLAQQAGLDTEVWSGDDPEPNVDCLVVNMTGVLADIYALASIAYVGGGFRQGGLHAVSEPAAFAVPVIVGPHYDSSADAELLISAGGGNALPAHRAEDHLARWWLEWLGHNSLRTATGLKARSILRQGASDDTVRRLLRLLDVQ
jgi:3-deoxy-D-manno-octulosonic-acid transferase